MHEFDNKPITDSDLVALAKTLDYTNIYQKDGISLQPKAKTLLLQILLSGMNVYTPLEAKKAVRKNSTKESLQ